MLQFLVSGVVLRNRGSLLSLAYIQVMSYGILIWAPTAYEDLEVEAHAKAAKGP